jgi:hypothetical protein
LNELSLEVAALQALYDMQIRPDQLKALRELAQGAASQPSGRRPGKASARFRDLLVKLHQALIDDSDDERIADLSERVERMRQSEKPALDDEVEVTDEAAEAAPRVLKLLSAAQVAAYAGALADEIGDPLAIVLDAVATARDMDDKRWKEFRTTTVEEVGMLLGGVDGTQSAAYRDKVLQLLIVVRGLSDEEFRRQRAGLEKKARAVVGDVGSFEVLRHYLENRLAELLANPRLSAAIDARLKAGERGASAP